MNILCQNCRKFRLIDIFQPRAQPLFDPGFNELEVAGPIRWFVGEECRHFFCEHCAITVVDARQ